LQRPTSSRSTAGPGCVARWCAAAAGVAHSGGSVGGWAALVGALVLGPRLGKYGKDGRMTPIPGSNMPAATMGVMLLWLGWFGFNAGSALTAGGLASSAFIATNTSAAAAALTWMILGWINRRPSVLGTATGAVVGLVAITPAAGFVHPLAGIPIGAVASILSYYVMIWRIKAGKVDESLDVFACHGVGGAWGALATGIFATVAVNSAGADGLLYGGGMQVFRQLAAVGATCAYVFAVSLILAKILKAIMGLRVSENEEVVGLDISQHGERAYGGTS